MLVVYKLTDFGMRARQKFEIWVDVREVSRARVQISVDSWTLVKLT